MGNRKKCLNQVTVMTLQEVLVSPDTVSRWDITLKKMRFKMCLGVSVIIVLKQKIFNLANRFYF